MAPFAHHAAEEPRPESAGGDAEVPEGDAAEQRQDETGEDIHEEPAAALANEAPEADALEQQREVPYDDGYDDRL